ncbi:sigma-70 family RNA polymerase sigma factor [Paenibacillus doosanensis]|uniref:RNA polymerase sigma factor n=1 Tax=Paenibacillus konkukensis TaxID=2020716 RepID=A0ABY4RSV9_9BACL|nr:MULTISPECIES: sigma-70 family RNA polymerase sigma factor [Paenibacillus]MCS7461254.1 sigma-70 family RNA polymerase sigma factor [Paenibacillus doosanensis]UQZ85305.1 RNA polymerase sigma factor SigM [Paenibacillus konkukensis]
MAFEYLKSISGGMDKNAVLEELMHVYGDDVWHYAFFLTRRKELADDIAQEVFVKVYERLYSFRGEATVKTWLLAITRNLVKDHWRSAWMRRVIPFGLRRRADGGPSAEAEAMGRFVAEEVWRIVLELPRKLREVLLLHAHHQLTHTEIARLLSLSEGTVKSRLHRARAKVTQRLNEEGAQ